MVGAVVGKTKGVAPGALMSMAYKKFDLSTESEYVFNTEDQADNFFYTWSELGYSPIDWLRVGVAGQRTRAPRLRWRFNAAHLWVSLKRTLMSRPMYSTSVGPIPRSSWRRRSVFESQQRISVTLTEFSYRI